MATVPSLSQLNEIKNSLGVWVEIIGKFKECFSALSRSKVLETALVKLATESNKLNDAEKKGLDEMIEYCRQSSVAERKAEIVVGTINSIVKSTLKALHHSEDTVKICKRFLKKIKSKYSELEDAIEEIGKVVDSFLRVQTVLLSIRNQCESQRNQLNNESSILKREKYSQVAMQMASIFPAIASLILVAPLIGPAAAVSGSPVVVTVVAVAVKTYAGGFGAKENRILVKDIERVEHYFEETQNGLEKSHKAIAKKLGLLLKIKRETDEASCDTEDVSSGLGSSDDVKEDLERLKCLCEEYLELSSSVNPRNVIQTRSSTRLGGSKRKRNN